MRNPLDPGWPEQGERTTLLEAANRWKWAYADWATGEHRSRIFRLPPKQQKLSEIVPAYLDDRLNTAERGTWSQDRSAMVHFLPAFGSSTPSEVTSEKMQAWVTSLVRRGYRPNTVRGYVNAISGFYRRMGYPNPTKDLETPDPGKQDVRWWSDSEVKRLREAASKVDAIRPKSPSCRLALEVGLSMGLRQAEIFGLRWEDIRAREKVVRVDRQTEKDRNTTKPLKGKLSRTALILPDWWKVHQKNRMGYVLPGRDGEPVTSRTQRTMMERVLDTAGLNGLGVGWHSLRHTYSARYLLAGGTIFGLQKSLGHASVQITERAYQHLTSDRVASMEAANIYKPRKRVRRA